MKKLIFALSALLLFLPALSIAEGEITVSGAALNAAQRAMMTSAEESVTISELLRWDNESYTTLIWHGMENGSPHFTIMDSETGFNYLLEDYAYRLDEVTGLPYTCVFTGTALADAKENLSDLLSIFDDETSYTFVPQADGTAVFSETYALDDDVFTDTYTLYADTLELVEFHAQVAAKDGAVTEDLLLSVSRGELNLFASLLSEIRTDEFFPITLISNSGIQTTVVVPRSLPVRFTDGIEDVLMFLDSGYEQPVDRFLPYECETDAVTLYEGTEE